MDEFEAFETYDDYEVYNRGHRRNVRRNIFVELSERQFLEFFRFDKEGVGRLVDLLRDHLGEEEEDSDIEDDGDAMRPLSLEFQVNIHMYVI